MGKFALCTLQKFSVHTVNPLILHIMLSSRTAKHHFQTRFRRFDALSSLPVRPDVASRWSRDGPKETGAVSAVSLVEALESFVSAVSLAEDMLSVAPVEDASMEELGLFPVFRLGVFRTLGVTASGPSKRKARRFSRWPLSFVAECSAFNVPASSDFTVSHRPITDLKISLMIALADMSLRFL